MTDISEHLPKTSKTVEAIYAAYKKAGDTGYMSQTLSISLLGHSCERYLWYCFRQCCKPEFDGRMYRLFETGNLEETRFVKDLRAIGCTVHDVDESRAMERTQQYKVTAFSGHLKGYLDGCALGIPEAPKTWHVLEFKTHNNKSFAKLKKNQGGVIASNFQHFAQMQVYMHLTGMKRALYLARNKDTDELYSERIHYDEIEATALMDRAGRVITATTPPDRISERPDYYQCGWCDAKEICWGEDETHGRAFPVPALSCRQCCHATPDLSREDAQWKCEKFSFSDPGCQPCPDHLTLPGLLPFAEPTNYGSEDERNVDVFIEFTNEDGTKWKHGAGGYSSQELMKLPASALGNVMLETAKDLFGATVTDCQEDILKRYPEEDSRIIWKGPVFGLRHAWLLNCGSDLTTLKPIARFHNLPEYDIAELEGGRIVIMWGDGTAEIRGGVE